MTKQVDLVRVRVRIRVRVRVGVRIRVRVLSEAPLDLLGDANYAPPCTEVRLQG